MQDLTASQEAPLDADNLSANPTNDPETSPGNGTQTGGTGTSTPGADKAKKRRSVASLAKSALTSLKGIEPELDDEKVQARADRAGEIRKDITAEMARIRKAAEGKPKVEKKTSARALHALKAVDDDLDAELKELENGRLALTDEDLAILNG